MLEVGWRLLPDGTREKEVMPEPQTELYFLEQLSDVCSTFNRDQTDEHARKQHKAVCGTFVNEFEAELVAIKDWERVSVMQRSPNDGEKHALFTTKNYDELKTAVCTEETRACATADGAGGSKKKKGSGKKQQARHRRTR